MSMGHGGCMYRGEYLWQGVSVRSPFSDFTLVTIDELMSDFAL